MKKLVILLIILSSCQPSTPPKIDPPKKYTYTTVKKIVKGKSQEQTSTQSRKYSLWNDQFYNETQLLTIYYFAYTDMTTEEVDARTYALYDKGDTITKTIKQ